MDPWRRRFWTLLAVVVGVPALIAALLGWRPVPRLERAFSVAGLFEWWFLVNLVIANHFHSANGAVNFDFATSQPVENVWYTLAWAVIATGLLIVGFWIDWAAARGAAVALLVAAVFKAFLFDLGHLDGAEVPDALVGMGGAVTNLTAVMLGLATYDPDAVQGATLSRAEVERQIELYCSRATEVRRQIVGLQAKRADVILAGACIVRTVMDKLRKDSLSVSDRGLRHGLLVDRFGKQ
jgi:hypothetical protein